MTYLYAKHVGDDVFGFAIQVGVDQGHVVVRRDAVPVECRWIKL